MRIAMVAPFGLRPKSTVSRRALPLGKALAARGHRVRLVVPSWDWPAHAGRSWEEQGVEVRCPSFSRGPGLSWIALAARLVKSALDIHPQVVHCFKPKGFAGLVAFLLWYARKGRLWQGRLIVDSDDWEGRGGWNDRGCYSWVQRRTFAWQERWGLGHADAVTVASHALETLAWGLGVGVPQIHYLPNGMSPRPPAQAWTVRGQYGIGSQPVVLCYTRFVGCGPARWGAIVDAIAQRVPSAHFLVVGTGLAAEEEEFRGRIQSAGLTERLTCTGWVAEEALPQVFAAADVGLLPLDDNLVNRTRCPAKLCDLMAAGVPVLAEAVGESMSYIENRVSGVLLPPGSEPAMWAAEAAALLEDVPRRRALGAAGRERMEKQFTWDRLAEGLLAAYPAD